MKSGYEEHFMPEARVKDGGPAFPRTIPIYDNGARPNVTEGMTLRDWFAGKALQGMIARTNWGIEDDARDISDEAYGYADAMLKAREEG